MRTRISPVHVDAFTAYHFPLLKDCTFTVLSQPFSGCKAKGLQMEFTWKIWRSVCYILKIDFLLLRLAFPLTVTHPFAVLCSVDKVQTTLWIIHSRVTCNAEQLLGYCWCVYRHHDVRNSLTDHWKLATNLNNCFHSVFRNNDCK